MTLNEWVHLMNWNNNPPYAHDEPLLFPTWHLLTRYYYMSSSYKTVDSYAKLRWRGQEECTKAARRWTRSGSPTGPSVNKLFYPKSQSQEMPTIVYWGIISESMAPPSMPNLGYEYWFALDSFASHLSHLAAEEMHTVLGHERGRRSLVCLRHGQPAGLYVLVRATHPHRWTPVLAASQSRRDFTWK